MTARILVVDDEETAREELAEAIRDAGMEVATAENGRRGLELAGEMAFDVCVTDIRMPEMDGIELLERLRRTSPKTLTIILTAYGALETALAALRTGAADYILKPVIFDDLLHKIRRLLEHRDLEMQVQSLRRTLEGQQIGQSLIGESPSLHRIKKLIAKVGPTRSSALITGESGTGKELVAQAIHAADEQAGRQPFVPFNCAAIPESLVESELFGHVRGAFTGATSTKEGLLRSAGEGSIFLDEVGEMPLAVQAKLLRALDSREIRPLGSVRRVPINARIIAATNKDLTREIEEKRFREDLYYRLAVVEIDVPPLRERKEDLPTLIDHFVVQHGRKLHRTITGVSPRALDILLSHDWPGNVRELANVIERGVILAEGPVIQHVDLPRGLAARAKEDPVAVTDLRRSTRRFERAHIESVVLACSGDKKEAARRLGISLASLYRKSAPSST
jgi:two-component system response regulator PilR (NtrC family)